MLYGFPLSILALLHQPQSLVCVGPIDMLMDAYFPPLDFLLRINLGKVGPSKSEEGKDELSGGS